MIDYGHVVVRRKPVMRGMDLGPSDQNENKHEFKKSGSNLPKQCVNHRVELVAKIPLSRLSNFNAEPCLLHLSDKTKQYIKTSHASLLHKI